MVEPNKNPVYLYKAMFANLVPTTISNPKSLAAATRNKSILDTSVADIKELKSQLGRSDNMKLDQHLSTLRALEIKLNAAGNASPTLGGYARSRRFRTHL